MTRVYVICLYRLTLWTKLDDTRVYVICLCRLALWAKLDDNVICLYRMGFWAKLDDNVICLCWLALWTKLDDNVICVCRLAFWAKLDDARVYTLSVDLVFFAFCAAYPLCCIHGTVTVLLSKLDQGCNPSCYCCTREAPL